MKLHFAAGKEDTFADDLRNISSRYAKRYRLIPRARRLLWIKLCFYSLSFCAAYAWLLTDSAPTPAELAMHYIAVGLSGLLLAFNTAHDAVHSTFSSRRWVNRSIFTLTFNLQGLSGYLWRIRHLASHHVFPNVDGCDADIDDNPFIRLSPHQPRRFYHRYQHLYATVLYMAYTLHWMLIKDVQYLLKKDLANLRNQRHSFKAILQIAAWKAAYFCYMLLIPSLLIDSPGWWIILSFLLMHGVLSIGFVLTLIISHLCEETEFPLADKDGLLPFNYHKHQLAVSLDYHAESRLANWVFGGFNAHAAHHLFPRLPHTCYPQLTKVIRRITRIHGYPYNELPIPKAIGSHYRYLQRVGNPSSIKAALLLILMAWGLAANGQIRDRNVINRKALSVGYNGISLRTSELNMALNAADYPTLPGTIGVANIIVSSSFGPRWGGFYGVDLSTLQSETTYGKSFKFRFNRFYGGLEIPIMLRPGFSLRGRAGLSSSNLELRLYDTAADTTNLSNYLRSQADAKLVRVGFISLDFGFQAELAVHRNAFLAVRGGYILNPGAWNYRHDAGRFDNGPAVGLGSWYFGVQAGLHFLRRIIRVDSWQQEDPRKSALNHPVT